MREVSFAKSHLGLVGWMALCSLLFGGQED